MSLKYEFVYVTKQEPEDPVEEVEEGYNVVNVIQVQPEENKEDADDNVVALENPVTDSLISDSKAATPVRRSTRSVTKTVTPKSAPELAENTNANGDGEGEVQPEPELTFELFELLAPRGKKMLLDSEGYHYTIKSETEKLTLWNCTIRRKDVQCPATVGQKGDVFKRHPRRHTHPPPSERSLTKKKVPVPLKKILPSVFQDGDQILTITDSEIEAMLQEEERENSSRVEEGLEDSQPGDESSETPSKKRKLSLNDTVESSEASFHEEEDTEPVTYEVLESGSQRGGKKLLDSRGFSYTVKRTNDKMISWWCDTRSKHTCIAGVTQSLIDGSFKPGRKTHTHPPKEGFLDLLHELEKLPAEWSRRTKLRHLATQKKNKERDESRAQKEKRKSELNGGGETMHTSFVAMSEDGSFSVEGAAAYDVPEATENISVTDISSLEPEIVITYEVLEAGSMRGHKKLVDSEGYTYTVKREQNDTTIWTCSVRNKNVRCPATVRQDGQKYRRGRCQHVHTETPGLPRVETVTKELEKQQQMDAKRLKVVASEAIDYAARELYEVSQSIWVNPELQYEEHHAHQLLTEYLAVKGFQVTPHFHLNTAFHATHRSSDTSKDRPNIAILCEYDALPEIGHGCGHNLIAEVGIGAGLGVMAAMEVAEQELGQVTIIGCPAEEGGGGKIDLINAGVFKDIDIAIMAHPYNYDLPRSLTICLREVYVTFRGKSSHAAGFPWRGVNALDAAVMAYNNISCLRQQLKPSWRVHGVFTIGGAKPNIIPEVAELYYYLRTPSEGELAVLCDKAQACFEGAGTASGCQVELRWDAKPYTNMLPNNTLSKLYESNSTKLGTTMCRDEEILHEPTGSTDMGNLSHVVPSIHPHFSIGTNASAHTHEFREASGSVEAQEYTIRAAKALAMTAIDVFCQPRILRFIKMQFDADVKKDTETGVPSV